jgi:hypothetical protein
MSAHPAPSPASNAIQSPPTAQVALPVPTAPSPQTPAHATQDTPPTAPQPAHPAAAPCPAASNAPTSPPAPSATPPATSNSSAMTNAIAYPITTCRAVFARNVRYRVWSVIRWRRIVRVVRVLRIGRWLGRRVRVIQDLGMTAQQYAYPVIQIWRAVNNAARQQSVHCVIRTKDLL